MIFIVNKKTKRIIMRSSGTIKVNPKKFNVVDYTPTIAEQIKIDQNYKLSWIKSKLVLDENDLVKFDKKKSLNKSKLLEIKDALDNPSVTKHEIAQRVIEMCNIIET